ncbi:MAG TPA: ion channel [Acidobacteriaceae bacterium]
MNDEKTPATQQAPPVVGGRFFFLFLFLLIQLVLYPYAGEQGVRYQWYRLLSFFITIASIYAVSFRRSTWIIALLFAIPVIWHRTILSESTASKLALAGLMLGVAFDLLIVLVVFHRVFHTRDVTAQTIFGAVSIYLLVGFAFTRIYMFLVALQPGAFYLDPILNRNAVPDHSALTFYSFGVMTSLGAAGISPVTGQARSLTIIEAILGILYLGVLVSRLIAMYRPAETSLAQQKQE